MSSLLSRILWTCPHQFSWPRRDDAGDYYQWCVNCGTKYRYDWKRMRRTARVDDNKPPEPRRSHRTTKPTWIARERRLRHVVPLLYRIGTAGDWIEGTSENLSRSGLLFLGNATAALGESVHIKLEMPSEITGDGEDEVLCRATVARVTEIETGAKTPPAFLIACAIEDYEFMKKPNSPVA
ncbi:MAG TPA: PilZ domain-containing protein [Candidatus Koribacter sp.]|jgi:hypothetical protein